MTQRVFIVHGHDEAMKEEVSNFVREIGFDPIILHERPDLGRTVIEKLEQEAANVGFAIILLSPDDLGAGVGKESKLNHRARQNVILELGYFVRGLGRQYVCILNKGNVEIPSDILGVLYNPFDTEGNWKHHLIREMEAIGMAVKTSSRVVTQIIDPDNAVQVLLLPNLKMPKTEVEEKIKKQIELGREIAHRQIRTMTGLKPAQIAQEHWNSYNMELLARSFDSALLAEKYQKVTSTPNATYQKASRGKTIMRSEIEQGILLLTSILQRLELLPEVSSQSSNTPTPTKSQSESVLVSSVVSGNLNSSLAQIVLNLEAEYSLPEQPPRDHIDILKFTPDGRQLIGGLNQGLIAVWDTATGELKNIDVVKELSRDRGTTSFPMYSFAISPDGKFLATPTHGRAIQLWHFNDLKPYRLIETVNHPPISIAFSSNADWLVAGLDIDGYIYSWSTNDDFRRVDHVKAHESRVQALKFHPSRLSFISCSSDGYIKQWEIIEEEIKVVRSYEGHDRQHVVDIAFSPNGHLLASGSVSGQIILWEAETGKPIMKMSHETVIRTLAFSPDGRFLASGSNDRTLKIWDVVNGRKLISKKFDHAIRTLDFAPNSQLLVIATEANKKVQIWRIKTENGSVS